MDDQQLNKDLILRENLALQRTTLSNQTTFLAYLRTSMYFLIAAFSLNNFWDSKSSLFWERLFIVISAVIFVWGILNFFYHKRRIIKCRKNVGKFKGKIFES